MPLQEGFAALQDSILTRKKKIEWRIAMRFNFFPLVRLNIFELRQSSVHLFRNHLANNVRVVLAGCSKYARLIQTREICVCAFESIHRQCSANEASPERVAVTLFYHPSLYTPPEARNDET